MGSAGEVNPQSLDVEIKIRRSLVGDGRIIQDRERDCHQAGETAEVLRTSPAGKTPPLTEIEHHNPEHTSAGNSTRTCLPGVTGST